MELLDLIKSALPRKSSAKQGPAVHSNRTADHTDSGKERFRLDDQRSGPPREKRAAPALMTRYRSSLVAENGKNALRKSALEVMEAESIAPDAAPSTKEASAAAAHLHAPESVAADSPMDDLTEEDDAPTHEARSIAGKALPLAERDSTYDPVTPSEPAEAPFAEIREDEIPEPTNVAATSETPIETSPSLYIPPHAGQTQSSPGDAPAELSASPISDASLHAGAPAASISQPSYNFAVPATATPQTLTEQKIDLSPDLGLRADRVSETDIALTSPSTKADTQTTSTRASTALIAQELLASVRKEAKTGVLEIRLDPPELGKVQIRFNFDRADGAAATIAAERSETLDLLRRNAAALLQELERGGLVNIDIEFSLSPDLRGFVDSEAGAGVAGELDDMPAEIRDLVYIAREGAGLLNRIV